MNLIFDGNYLFHKTFSVFSTYYRDIPMENVLEDKEKRQVLMRKCIIDLCFCVSKFKNVDCVTFVIDSSSWRYNIFEDYKYALTKIRDTFYKQFLDCLDEFERLLRSRGLIVSRVPGAEGDDLLFMWSFYFGYCKKEETVIITGDSDICQLVTPNVSVFNNNSKNLRLFCYDGRDGYWNDEMDTDVSVIPINPFEVVLRKVILGDKSDNIPSLKRGFGEKSFERFIESIKPYREPRNMSLVETARWIASRFCDFTKIPEEDILGKIIFNLKMTWLNLSAYNETDYITYDGKSLLECMSDNVTQNSNKYTYNKPYTLENFYGMLIK